MVLKEINNEFSIVFYVRNSSVVPATNNPCYQTFKNIVVSDPPVDSALLKENQTFGFIAKVLNDALLNSNKNYSEIKSNIIDKLDSFKKNRNKHLYEEVLEILFYSWLIKLKGNDKYYEIFSEVDLQHLLSNKIGNNRELEAKRIVLNSVLLNNISEILETENDIYLLTLKYIILFYQLNNSKNENKLIELYVTQKEIEESSKALIRTSNPLIFEIAFMLDIVTHNGLYLSNSEKLVYLSNSGREFLATHFIEIINQAFKPIFKKIPIPLWLFPILIIGLQVLFFISLETNIIDGFGIWGVSLKKDVLATIVKAFPIYLILLFNCIVFVILILLIKKNITQKVKNGK